MDHWQKQYHISDCLLRLPKWDNRPKEPETRDLPRSYATDYLTKFIDLMLQRVHKYVTPHIMNVLKGPAPNKLKQQIVRSLVAFSDPSLKVCKIHLEGPTKL